MTRSQAGADPVRERAVDAALEILETKGPNALTLGETASRMGVSIASLQRTFESYDALLEAIAERWFRRKVRIMEEVVASDLPPRRKMYEFFARRFAVLRDDFNAAPNRALEPASTDPVRMANTRAFIDKLDTAIAQQQREVDVADARVTEATHAVQGAEMRLKALERLRERRDAEQMRVENRREQIRTDAYAARAAREGGASLEGRG